MGVGECKYLGAGAHLRTYVGEGALRGGSFMHKRGGRGAGAGVEVRWRASGGTGAQGRNNIFTIM